MDAPSFASGSKADGGIKVGNANGGADLESVLDSEYEHQGQASVFHTIVNIICTTVGVGMVGLPIAFAQAGWLFSILGMTIGYIISVYCGVILWRALNCHEQPIPTFMDLGYLVAGRWGKAVTGFSVYGTCLGASILFIILAADQFQIIFGSNVMDPKLWALVFVGITLPFAYMKTLGHVAIIAVFGALSSAIVFLVVVIQDIIQVSDSANLAGLNTVTEVVNTDNVMNIVTAINTFIFSFGASVIFAESNIEMRNRNRFPFSVTAAYGFAFIVYMVISCVSYGVYGRSLLTAPGGSIIGMLPDNWATKMMSVLLVVHLLSAFLVLLNPVFRAVETATGSDNHRLAIPFRIVQRLIIIGVCYFVAIAIPFFGQIMSLMGATTITLSSFICPSWFYLALFWRKSSPSNGESTSNTNTEESAVEMTGNNATASKSDNTFATIDDNTKSDSGKVHDVTSSTVCSNVTKFGARVSHYTVPTWEAVFNLTIIVCTGALGIVGTYQSIKTIIDNASTYTFF